MRCQPETVYGLAADAANDDAVRKIFEAKGRPADHPLIVHIPEVDHLERWAIDIPDLAFQIAEQFWPGPLTLLLKKAPQVSSVVTGGRDTIALRIPEHTLFREILKQANLGLAAPSANRYKKLSPTTADQVIKGMRGRISAVLDGGSCEFGLESTIIDLTSERPTIVRTGPITRASLERQIGCEFDQPESHNVAVPGNVAATLSARNSSTRRDHPGTFGRQQRLKLLSDLLGRSQQSPRRCRDRSVSLLEIARQRG